MPSMPVRLFLLFSLLGPMLLGLPSPAAAEGFYASVFGGGVLLNDAGNDSNSGSFNLEFDPGYLAGGSLGYDLGTSYPALGQGRMEVEFAWRRNDLDEAEFADSRLPAEGDVTAWSLMFNTIGEVRPRSPWMLFALAGIGVANVSYNDVREAGQWVVDGDDTVFAWQVGGGVGYEATDWLILDLAYRFFSALDPEFTDETGSSFESEYDSHAVLAGVRLTF